MASFVHYKVCPVCGSSALKQELRVTDFTVSKETFSVLGCNTCSLRFTQDVPDSDSIAPYYKSEEYISHSDTSRGLINSLYKKIRRLTLKQKRSMLEAATGLKSGNLLDYGSGTGAFLNEMKQAGWRTTGLEPDTAARALAKKQYGLHLSGPDGLYNLVPGSFDAVTLWHVLEHVHELHATIAQLKKLLSPNGRIFIAVPNYTSGDAKAYREFWAAYDVPRHLYHFSPTAMEQLIKNHGMVIRHFKPMWFDSFYVSLLSSKYKNPATNWFGALWTACLSNLSAIGNPKKCSSVIYIISH